MKTGDWRLLGDQRGIRIKGWRAGRRRRVEERKGWRLESRGERGDKR